MKYIKYTETQGIEVITDEINSHFPNTQFPINILATDLPDNWYFLIRSDEPYYDSSTHYLEESVRTINPDTKELYTKFTPVAIPEAELQNIKATRKKIFLETHESEFDLFLDKVAKSRGYDNRYSCMLRVAYQGPYYEDGLAFARWRDVSYYLLKQHVNNIEQDELPPPASVKEVFDKLPKIVWPN